MTARPPIRGVFTPNIVPLDARGEINEAELRRYVDWLIAQGVHGLYPNGSTGEFTRFTPEERRRIVEIVVDQVAGRALILAGAAEANVRETLKACEHYAGLGVRAVAIVAPFYYKHSPDAVHAYFSQIAAATPVDVTLYHIPMFASPIDVPTVQRLSEKYERVVAIKDSSGDLVHMQRMVAAVRPNRPDFAFLTGWDAMLAASLFAGCDGATLASSGIVPGLTREIFEASTAGRWDQARAAQQRLLPLFDEMMSIDFPAGVREALSLRGFQLGATRQPLSAAQRERLVEMRPRLQALIEAATGSPG